MKLRRMSCQAGRLQTSLLVIKNTRIAQAAEGDLGYVHLATHETSSLTDIIKSVCLAQAFVPTRRHIYIYIWQLPFCFGSTKQAI